MQFLRRRDGTVLHYQTIGAPEGRPALVFINALGTDFRIWRDVIVRLAGEFSILTYDLRGHGLSDVGPGAITMADHAADLAALIERENLGRTLICGLSIGGLIAQELAATRPDLVRALILCGTAGRIGDADLWNARIAAVRSEGIAAIADGILERWFTRDFRSADNPEFIGYRNMLVRQPVEGYVASCAAIRDFDRSADAPDIAVPTLCAVGEADGATPTGLVADFARTIPGARFERIGGAGHIPSVEAPQFMADMIRAFASFAGRDEPSGPTH
ncbi:3-oxoadipate enol-lactonase [Pelagibacterium montanilacus]|uniref:3-oxoadipate enol-lactonase n=1 Tax=Pelagibacterium montanilacus TaxID=2185280 RepID=UPI000F8D0BBC|nr:3-oxoadipate enol-lactonase [Pelagibacterium montanilacus]